MHCGSGRKLPFHTTTLHLPNEGGRLGTRRTQHQRPPRPLGNHHLEPQPPSAIRQQNLPYLIRQQPRHDRGATRRQMHRKRPNHQAQRTRQDIRQHKVARPARTAGSRQPSARQLHNVNPIRLSSAFRPPNRHRPWINVPRQLAAVQAHHPAGRSGQGDLLPGIIGRRFRHRRNGRCHRRAIIQAARVPLAPAPHVVPAPHAR